MAIKTVRGLIRRAKATEMHWTIPYFESLEKDASLINDFIVYNGERTLLSIVDDLESVKGLIRMGASPLKPAFSNLKHNYHYPSSLCTKVPAFHYFAFKCNSTLAVIKYFIEEVGIDVNAKDSLGNTALHYALVRSYPRREESRNLDLARYLISKGANPLALNNQFLTPLNVIVEDLRQEAYKDLTANCNYNGN